MTEYTEPRIVGLRLKQRRKELHLTQKDVAEQLNVAVPTVSMWESGQRTPLDRDKVEICRLYGRRVEKIFFN